MPNPQDASNIISAVTGQWNAVFHGSTYSHVANVAQGMLQGGQPVIGNALRDIHTEAGPVYAEIMQLYCEINGAGSINVGQEVASWNQQFDWAFPVQPGYSADHYARAVIKNNPSGYEPNFRVKIAAGGDGRYGTADDVHTLTWVGADYTLRRVIRSDKYPAPYGPSYLGDGVGAGIYVSNAMATFLGLQQLVSLGLPPAQATKAAALLSKVDAIWTKLLAVKAQVDAVGGPIDPRIVGIGNEVNVASEASQLAYYNSNPYYAPCSYVTIHRKQMK